MTRPKAIGKPGSRLASRRRAKAENGAMRAADVAPRKTGIRTIGDMPWGTHLCVFYETKEDLLETAAAYFGAGLQSNEFCVWAVSEPLTIGEAEDFLRRNVANFDEHLATGRFEILAGHDWYLKEDHFDLKRITGGWTEKLQQALAKGYEGMRVSGNAFWTASNLWSEFCDYERSTCRWPARR